MLLRNHGEKPPVALYAVIYFRAHEKPKCCADLKGRNSMFIHSQFYQFVFRESVLIKSLDNSRYTYWIEFLAFLHYSRQTGGWGPALALFLFEKLSVDIERGRKSIPRVRCQVYFNLLRHYADWKWTKQIPTLQD